MFLIFFLSLPFADSLPLPSAGGYRGSWKRSTGGRTFAAFKGIRYAQPPTGGLRFQETVLNVNASQIEGEILECLQINIIDDDMQGDEDCLFLNVYSPKLDGRMPVMVWIHGGAFFKGSSKYEIYGPQMFMDHDVVVVTFNYRLGALGFASLEGPWLAGDYGLKDQKAALDWVVRNIAAFGGDPGQVTVAGHSAGAASALYLAHSDGRVRGCVALSGTRYSPWALSEDFRVRNNTKRLMKALNCTDLDCLRRTDARNLTLTAKNSLYTWDRLLIPYRPVVDGDMIKTDPWLGGAGRNFSLLIGVTQNEADFLSVLLNSWSDEKKNALFRLFLDEIAMVDRMAGHGKRKALERMNDFYWRRGPDRIVELVSDSSFLFPAVAEAKSHRGDLYAFMFAYKSRLPYLLGTADRTGSGVAHGDELPFLFDSTGSPLGDDPGYRNVSVRLTETVVRFIKGLNPNLNSWKEDREIFSIKDALFDPEIFKEIDEGIYERMDFWKSLNFLKDNSQK